MEKKKTQIRPLQLSRETLRHLDNNTLDKVAGGLVTLGPSYCPSVCLACQN